MLHSSLPQLTHLIGRVWILKGEKYDIAIVKYGEKDYLKNTDLAYVVCDKIVDADSISFVYHGEYETWHFKLLNTEAN